MKRFPTILVSLITLMLVLIGMLFFRMHHLEQSLHKFKDHHPLQEEGHDEVHLGEKMSKIFYFKNKLGAAIQNENVELSSFYLHEIEEITEELVDADVYDEGISVSSLLQSELIPAIEQLERSLDGDDNNRQTTTAYENLISTCNDCHKLAKHPFIVIESPSQEPDGQSFISVSEN